MALSIAMSPKPWTHGLWTMDCAGDCTIEDDEGYLVILK